MILYWQGDCHFEEVEEIPKGSKEKKDNIVLMGSSGQNAHILNGVAGRDYKLYDKDGTTYVKALKNQTVSHNTHPTISDIPKKRNGGYKINRPLELDPFEQKIREQQD